MKNLTKPCFCVAHPFTVFACCSAIIFYVFNGLCRAKSFYCGPKLIIFRGRNKIRIWFFKFFIDSAGNTRWVFAPITKCWFYVLFECIDFIANVFEFAPFFKCVSFTNRIRYNGVNIFINRGKNTTRSIIFWGLWFVFIRFLNISIYDLVCWSVAENCSIWKFPVVTHALRTFVDFRIVIFQKIINLKLLNRVYKLYNIVESTKELFLYWQYTNK